MQHFQKEAIWRQMQEYKRERNILENRVEELEKKSVYHDDHLRIVDAWWSQLLDEVRLVAGDAEVGSNLYQNGDASELPSSLFFDDVTTFTNHLKHKRDQITSSLKNLFEMMKNGAPLKSESERIDDLQQRIRQLLIHEKANKVEISRLEKELEGANTRLAEATVKYLTAEKKADRLRSQTVAKIERQARASSTTEVKDEPDKDHSERDKDASAKATEGHLAEVELARKEAQVVVNKQKDELAKQQNEIVRLSEQVTSYTVKLARLTEEDISGTDAYKNLKVRLEDLAARYNHLEATNKELTERAAELESERSAFKDKLLEEQEKAILETQMQLSKTEQDLARIRSARDELLQDVALRKAREEQKFSTIKEANELAQVRAMRIESLEQDIERLKTLLDQDGSATAEVAEMDLEQLRQKYDKLEKSYNILTQELPALEQTYKKAHELATKKVDLHNETLAKINRVMGEKNKADSKYFAAMKAKESLQNETRAVRNQNAKSTEIITQLKEAEKRVRELVHNLEKQVAEYKSINQAMVLKHKEVQTRITEQANTIDSLKLQVGELGNSLRSRDTALAKEVSARREAEIDVEKFKTRAKELERALDNINKQSENTDDSQLEALKQIALCTVCRIRFKNTAIKNCGHVFCRPCADERIAARSRKCPNCGRGFAATDLFQVHL
ncbi:E3 ubiquitin-protein ligase bre1 [Ascodesmis nigricans]|uniref:E3 ubiquitin protein ligase n=1 Tax=Ascodesmis nigricans TaxID=341454 RepID=A0A4V3SIR9_9PEZI|nr:E3 ubiquitin-protein ligase bre1 [Ascodesmis nigricans]